MPPLQYPLEPAGFGATSSSLPSTLFPLSPHFSLADARTPSPPSRYSAGPSPAFRSDEDDEDGDALSLPPRVGYSSLPPSPTRSFVSLLSPESALLPDALDISLLRQRFESPEPDDGFAIPPQTGSAEPKKRSLWEHLQEEIWANDYESGQDLKCARWPALQAFASAC